MAIEHSMSPDEFRHLLAKLGFAGERRVNDLGYSAFARLVGKEVRTVLTWADRGPDNTAAVLLRLMHAAKIDARQAAELLAKPSRRR